MDAIDSYSSGFETKGIIIRINGTLKVKFLSWNETPCNCHPETCCHFDGKTTDYYDSFLTIDDKSAEKVKEGDEVQFRKSNIGAIITKKMVKL